MAEYRHLRRAQARIADWNDIITLILTRYCHVAPDGLWDIVTNYAALATVMKGIAEFEGFPAGRPETRQRFDVPASMFGKLPQQADNMEGAERDDTARITRSSEKGAGVKSGHHTWRVPETPLGRRLMRL